PSSPDFTISASPASVIANFGVTVTSSITVAPLNGFTGAVSLAKTTNSTNLACTLSSSSIPGGSGSSSLSCAGQSAGNYLAMLTGASGTLSHSTSVVYHVTNAPTFSVTANPVSVAVNSGVAGTSTITVSSQNGFTGAVTLLFSTDSTGLSCSVSTTTISGGSGSSTLSCTGSAAANYLAIVIGTSGALSSQTRVTYHVTPA